MKTMNVKEYVIIILIIAALFIITNTTVFSTQAIEPKPPNNTLSLIMPIIGYDADYTYPYTLPESLMTVSKHPYDTNALGDTVFTIDGKGDTVTNILDSTQLYEAWKRNAIVITATKDSSQLIVVYGIASNDSTRHMTVLDTMAMVSVGTYFWDIDAGYVKNPNGTEVTTMNTLPVCQYWGMIAQTTSDSAADSTYYYGVIIRDRH